MLDLLGFNNSRKTYVVNDNNQYSSSDIADLASSLSSYLIPRSLILILAENSIGSLLSYYASLKYGAIPLLLSSDTDPKVVSFYLNHYEINFILCPDALSYFFDSYSVAFRTTGYSVLCSGVKVKTEVHADLALLLTTSGSTGNPKLVKLSYQNIESNALSIIDYLNINHNSKHITLASYTYGLAALIHFIWRIHCT